MEVKKYPLNNQQINLKAGQIKKLLATKLIHTWLTQYKQNEKLLSGHSQLFNDYYENNLKCEKCKGIKHCVFKPAGYLKTPVYEAGLKSELKPCRYNHSPALTHKRYYLHNDYPVDWLLNSFSALKMPKTGNLKQVIAALDKLLSSEDHRGVFLYGALGVGKTLLMSCIANYFAKKQQTVSFHNVSTLANQARLYIEESGKLIELMDDMISCDVLLLDDIGASKVSEWIRDEWLYSVLNNRLENKRRTFLSSNLDYQGLKEYFSYKGTEDLKVIRLMERIEALTIPLHLEGENWRRKEQEK